MTKTLIIVPTVGKDLNNLYYEPVLQKCINSIENNTDESEYEIYIAINDYVGFAYAINMGLMEFLYNPYYQDFDGVVILNDDMEITKKDWLQKFKEKAINGLVTQLSQYYEYYCPMGCCYIPRNIIKKVGFLDEQFKILQEEDIDYCIRIQEAGYKIINLEEDIAAHGNSPTRSNAPAWAQEEIKKNIERFKEKYKGTKWLQILGR